MAAVMTIDGVASGRPRAARARVGGALVAVVLTAFLVGQGLRIGSTSGSASVPQVSRAEGIDAPAVADAMSHPVKAVAGRPGELTVGDDAYHAQFHASGFDVSAKGSGTDLRLALRAATRGGDTLPLDVGAWHGRSNVAERTVGAGLHEQVTATAGEVEWDVVVDAPPAGRGDLVLTAGLGGVAKIERRHSGLHIVMSGHGGALEMGALVVKDASGVVVHQVVPRVVGQQLQLVVPDRVLRHARYPLTLDPKVGPEKLVNDLFGTGTLSTATAFDGTNYLVVWSYGLCGCRQNLLAARVKPDGTVLDTTPLDISTADGAQAEPDVVFYGSNYLVVWSDSRAGGYDIYGTRVSTAGVVLDTLGLVINNSAGDQQSPAAAFDGTNVMVSWTDTRSGTSSDIYGTRWSPTNGVVDTAGFIVSDATGDQSFPDIVYYGGDYLVVWQDQRNGNEDIYAAVVHTSGVTRDTGGAAFSTVAGSQSQPALAFDGTNVLVVWADARSGTSTDIYATRWSPAAGLLEAAAFPVSTAGNDQSDPAVAFNGSFLVVWTDGRNSTTDEDIYAARVTKAGAVSDPSGIPVSTATGSERTASVIKGSGTKWLTFYTRSGTGATYARTVAPK